MCGIAGIFAHRGADRADEETVARMLGAIVHRGPDDEGIHTDVGLAIGARRLSIIDLPGGHQPIGNEDGSVVVAFNGEIYNYRELRERLAAAGHTLKTQGDTEVLVHLYEDFGDECVHHLRGMFAFAIWDGKRRRLLVARDRVGIKPLYWWDDDGVLLFGSEIKALLQHPRVAVRLDLEALAGYMLHRFVPAPRTMFAGVRSLEPGHMLTVDSSGIQVRRWWNLSFELADPPPSEAEAKARLREMLDDSVRSHMISDVPYGAFLSGGIDSSTIVALMSRQLGRPVSTFSVGYEGEGEALSELKYARMVAERYQTNHHEVMIDASDFVNLAKDVVWALDQPLADDACLPNFMVSRLAHQHVKMVLTGEGGDELFAGYARYAAEVRLAWLAEHFPSSTRRLPRSLGLNKPGITGARLAMYAMGEPMEAPRYAMYTPLMLPETRAALAQGELYLAAEHIPASDLYGRHLHRTDATQRLNRMLYNDLQHWLPDYLLLRGDKTSMAASLEARVPLLDHPLVEYAATLPTNLKLHGLGQTRKYLLREVARDLLPAPILSRTKKGFPVPISTWLRGGARSFSRDLLSPDVVRRRGLFQPAAITKILDQHESGVADHGSLLWGLISVELWHQLYVDRTLHP